MEGKQKSSWRWATFGASGIGISGLRGWCLVWSYSLLLQTAGRYCMLWLSSGHAGRQYAEDSLEKLQRGSCCSSLCSLPAD